MKTRETGADSGRPILVWSVESLTGSRQLFHERSLETLHSLCEKMDAILQPVLAVGPAANGSPELIAESLRVLGFKNAKPARILSCSSSSVGELSVRVAHYAEDIGAKAIVLSRRGDVTPPRWLAGSFGEHLINVATVPLILLRSSGAPCAEGWGKVRENYLFATDFSEFSRLAFRAFVEQVRLLHGRIVLYHEAAPLGESWSEMLKPPAPVPEKYFQKEGHRLREQARDWVEQAWRSGVEVEVVLEHGVLSVDRALTSVARRFHAMWIGLAHRKESVSTAYLGSVTRDSLAHQEFPLWIAGPNLRAPAHTAAEVSRESRGP